MPPCLTSWCAFFLFFFSATNATELPEIQAHITKQPPHIDGNLNDHSWQNASSISRFFQREPTMGAPSTELTELRILRDKDNIYIGIRCFDSEPNQIIASTMRRDGDVQDDDNIQIILDTYNDRRGGFFFATNPLGARLDMILSNEGRTQNKSWDSVWECRARIDSLGWSAEIVVPFDQLRFPVSEESIWGINVSRTIRRHNERTFLVPPPLSYGFFGHLRTSKIATLTGLGRLEERPRLEITPFAQVGNSQDLEDANKKTQNQLNSGADLKLGVTSTMTLDLSWRTDFAQVEADQQKVNLTRFSEYFPEKRDFFLEGADIFSFGERVRRFGGGNQPPTFLFYSRRIGLEEGHVIPVIAGGKLTGRAGAYQIGVLNIATQETRFLETNTDSFYQTLDGEVFRESKPNYDKETAIELGTSDSTFVDTTEIPRSHFSVIRLKRDLFSRSSIGLMAINRSPGSTSEHNRSLGLDADFSLLNTALNIRGFIARTITPSEPNYDKEIAIASGTIDSTNEKERESAGLMELDYRWGPFETRASYLDIGEAFNPEVGFVPRQGIRRFRGVLRFRPLSSTRWIRRYSVGPEFTYLTDLENVLQSRELRFNAFVNLESGDWIGVRLYHQLERLEPDEDAFEIHDNIIVPAGVHRFAAHSLNFFTDQGRRIFGNGSFELGSYWTGKRMRVSMDGTTNLSNHLSISSRFEVNRVRLPQGDFQTNTMSNRILYNFTTDLFIRGLVQWNSKQEFVGINALCNWRYRPGSDVFVVYSHVWDTQYGDPLNRMLQFKMTYFWKQ